jgi:hypothetical protein
VVPLGRVPRGEAGGARIGAGASGRAQLAAGALIHRALPPLRARLLAHWTRGGADLGGLARWLFVGLSRTIDREYYAPGTSTARREALKARCMGAGSGVRWARAYLARGFPDRYTPVLAMFRELERALAAGAVGRVHQVACCSGREIAYYARRFPGVAFRGSDGDVDVVEFLRETWRDVPNLSFARVRLERADAVEREALRSDLLYASGGFHYLDEPSLRSLLGAARALTSRLLLSQPVDRSFVMDAHAGSTPRTQLSWNHPYTGYLREAGWVDVGSEEGLVEELPWVKNVGVWARAG